MSNMYNQNPKKGSATIYNTPVKKAVNENQTEEKDSVQQEIKLLREAHVTEITLGNQTLRVMDAGHIQGVINMQEKQFKDIKQLQKTVNTQNRTIQALHQQMQNLERTVDELKSKLNGNFL